jgi:hypothetical protein
MIASEAFFVSRFVFSCLLSPMGGFGVVHGGPFVVLEPRDGKILL